jgi:hypothetical protein
LRRVFRSRLTPTRVPSLSRAAGEPTVSAARTVPFLAFLRLRRERSRPRTAVVRANGRCGSQSWREMARKQRRLFAASAVRSPILKFLQPSSPLVRLRHPKPDLNKVYKLYGHTTGANKN